ncbi:MAG: hypothetical protein HQ574_05860, partial [Chloroflexi bacterium]|nr:hypothetical protein [Chloroflexota bacterium]
MKYFPVFLLLTLTALLISSCGAIPTLPPLDSTVTIRTPQVTIRVGLVTAQSQETIAVQTGTTEVTATVDQSAPTKTPIPNTATSPPATATLKA